MRSATTRDRSPAVGIGSVGTVLVSRAGVSIGRHDDARMGIPQHVRRDPHHKGRQISGAILVRSRANSLRQ